MANTIKIMIPYMYEPEQDGMLELQKLSIVDGALVIEQNGTITGQMPLGISGVVNQHIMYNTRLRGSITPINVGGLGYLKYIFITADGVVSLRDSEENIITKGRTINLVDAMIRGNPQIKPEYKIMDYGNILSVQDLGPFEEIGTEETTTELGTTSTTTGQSTHSLREYSILLGDTKTEKPKHFGSSVLRGQERKGTFRGHFILYFQYANHTQVRVEIDEPEQEGGYTGEELAPILEHAINSAMRNTYEPGLEYVYVRYEDYRFVVTAADVGRVYLNFIYDSLCHASTLGLTNAELTLGTDYTATHVILPDSDDPSLLPIKEIKGGKIYIISEVSPVVWQRCYVVSNTEPINVTIFCAK